MVQKSREMGAKAFRETYRETEVSGISLRLRAFRLHCSGKTYCTKKRKPDISKAEHKISHSLGSSGLN